MNLPMTLGEMNFESDVDCTQRNVGAGAGNAYTKVLYVPKSGVMTMVGKILSDFRDNNRANYPIEYHEFSVGSTAQDSRFFFSPRCFGEPDPLTALFWDAVKERKKVADVLIAKYGSRENAKAAMLQDKNYCHWDFVAKMCRPKRGVLLYWVGKGASKVEPLMLKEQMADNLFGSPAKKDAAGKEVPPVQGLVKAMREMNLSPFNLKDPCGWVKLYKTGTGPTTQFHAELEEVKRSETDARGRARYFSEATEASVDAAILNVDANTIPKFPDICKELSWSPEEMNEYIQSDFTKVPQRYFKRTTPAPLRQQAEPESHGREVANLVDAAYETGNQVTEEDIEF
jgi:hypothetical protein